MKILFLTNVPSPYRVDFFNELGKLCELTVLFERKSASNRDKNWKSQGSKNFKSFFLKGIKVGHDSGVCLSVLKYIKRKEYDFIVIGGYSTPTGMLSIIYLNHHKIPFILNCDGGVIKQDSRWKMRIKKYFLGSANSWLSTGEKCDEYLVHYGAKKENIYRYPFTSIKKEDILKTVITEEEKRILRNKMNINYENVVISVGQFIPRKGFDILLKACCHIDINTGVYIIGGKAIPEYVELRNKLHLKNVYFVDFKNQEELKEYYKVANVFVLPTREDIWGLVINEAMAYGLPVVTTDKCVAGLELVENYKSGFIVPSEDEKALSDKINAILYDKILKQKIGEENLKRIRKYSIEKMARVHKNIFQDLSIKEAFKWKK